MTTRSTPTLAELASHLHVVSQLHVSWLVRRFRAHWRIGLPVSSGAGSVA